MYPERLAEPEIREIGGESLAGSGFEAESPAHESDEQFMDEDVNQ
jgi:hypothetical protein